MTDKECCKIDAIVSIDSKGQIVLPKDLRERAQFKPSDKLALIGFERNEGICCVMIVKVDMLANAVTKTLSPLLNAVTKQEV